MAISGNTRSKFATGICDQGAADEVCAAVDANTAALAARVADNVAVLGETSDLTGVDGSGSNAAPLAGTESRLDVIEAKLDAVIGALTDAGLMASS